MGVMDNIDYWILGDMVTNFNVLSLVAILFAIYIYEIKEFIKYTKRVPKSDNFWNELL